MDALLPHLESIEEAIPVQSLAILGAIPRLLLFQGVVPRYHPIQIIRSPTPDL
jgi:hypothetical protein